VLILTVLHCKLLEEQSAFQLFTPSEESKLSAYWLAEMFQLPATDIQFQK